MPSFDIVSKIDMGELKNAVNQANREISGRFDFKGSSTSLDLHPEYIELKAEDEYKMRAALDILRTKMGKRNIGMNAMEPGDVQPSGNQMFKQILQLKQGINKEDGKKINKLVKSYGLKVSSSVMDEKIRVTGKKIDDLQKTWTMLQDDKNVKLELQMENMKR